MALMSSRLYRHFRKSSGARNSHGTSTILYRICSFRFHCKSSVLKYFPTTRHKARVKYLRPREYPLSRIEQSIRICSRISVFGHWFLLELGLTVNFKKIWEADCNFILWTFFFQFCKDWKETSVHIRTTYLETINRFPEKSIRAFLQETMTN